MLDAVLRMSPRRPQRGQGDHQLRGRDAVHRDGRVIAMPLGDPRGQIGKVEIGVVQNSLAGGQTMDVLAQFSATVGFHESDDIADFQLGCRIGHCGNPVRAQPAADLGKAGIVALQRFRPAVVGAAQPAVGVVWEPDQSQAG